MVVDKTNNLKEYLKDLYDGIKTKKPDASRNPQDFKSDILSIQTGGTLPTLSNPATAEQILTDRQAYDSDGNIVTGTMVDNGLINKTINGINDESVNIPEGYTKGGTVSLTTDIQDEVDIQEDLIDEIISIVNNKMAGGGEDMLQARVNATKSCDYLFYAYSGNNIDYIANLDTSNVTSMANMFRDCKGLTTIPLLNTSSVTNMNNMFYNCQALTSIPQLDTSKVTNISSMFYNCTALTTIPQLDTSNVGNMTNMFYNCSTLTTIPQLDTSSVTNMSKIFYGCTSLKSILMYGMKVNFDISASTQFERSDLVTILNNLATVTNTRTLTMGATNLAKLSDEQKQIATVKGWILV